MPARSKWYMTVASSKQLEQGDFLFNCPTIEVEDDIDYSALEESEEAPAKIVVRDFIVLSQSCDLEDGNIDYIIVCPIHLFTSMTEFHSNNKKGQLLSDKLPRFALLEKNDRVGFPQDHFVVDLASAHPLPLEYAKRFAQDAGNRLRLVSPYREYLSQKFAYLYMRVGKPTPVSRPD